jgi:hypothetical protein
MTVLMSKRHPRRITRPADVDQVVSIADLYATEACRMHEHVSGEDFHKAMSGAFLMFLTDVAQSES